MRWYPLVLIGVALLVGCSGKAPDPVEDQRAKASRHDSNLPESAGSPKMHRSPSSEAREHENNRQRRRSSDNIGVNGQSPLDHVSIMNISVEDIETLLFRPDDGSVSYAVKLVHIPTGKKYIRDESESQTLNRRKAAEDLVRDVASTHPDVPPPEMTLFDRVRTVAPNTHREGTIRQLGWHFKDSAWSYYIESDGRKISKQYRASDLERRDP